jgi:nucleoside-diphosphate-sugar epimerase
MSDAALRAFHTEDFALKILVAGASGVIGRVLVPMLTTRGHDVIALSRHNPSDTRNQESRVRYMMADVFDRSNLLSIFERECPAAVIHLLTDLKEQSSAANARIRDIGTRNLVDAAKAVGVTKMVAQSIAWAYEAGEGAATELTALDYAASLPRKTTIDGVVSLEGAVKEIPKHTILRLGTLYGPGTWYERNGAIAQTVYDGKMIATGAITSFLHVVDAVTAFVQALLWPDGPVNIVDDDPASALIWLPEYARELGAPAPLRNEEPALPTRAVSNQKAHDLGWTPAHPSWRGGFLS